MPLHASQDMGIQMDKASKKERENAASAQPQMSLPIRRGEGGINACNFASVSVIAWTQRCQLDVPHRYATWNYMAGVQRQAWGKGAPQTFGI